MVYAIETGKTGFEKANGMPLFDYLAQHPEEASLFSEAMAGLHSQEPPAVAAAYDFSIVNSIVDVGGATGNMLAAIFTRHAGPRGVLFDRPHVVADAPALLEAKGVKDRVKIEAGDFFKSVPAGGDAYVLSHIIHDWSDDQCLGRIHGPRFTINLKRSTPNLQLSTRTPGRLPHLLTHFRHGSDGR
jgi:hypothetical protein